MMEEQAYRSLVDETFNKIDAAFADVDPDQAESSLSQGALTILFPGGVRAILSPQTPVRQVWMAYKDHAWHFNWEASRSRWIDDRGKGVELYELVEQTALEAGGVAVSI